MEPGWNSLLRRDGGNYYTISIYPKPVYGEKVKKENGAYKRYWDPKRSKLSAALRKGLRNFPFEKNSTVLYLGASTGTTVSHIADLCPEGKIFAVEYSFESFTKLLNISEDRKNLYPFLEDAMNIENISGFIDRPEIIYQDISQRHQVQIFNLAASTFKTVKKAILIIKVRAISARQNDREIVQNSIKGIKSFRVGEIIDLKPYDKSNYLVYMER
ncbi:MAG: fibrillarin-like rRNA/tRNA 2'-O-methyltransferase [Thermoplasmataceae archaeon]|jgi:fibrillarin-like pre-rRNA processing protein|nr:fibrillarin-like rRNA/tRNA 2'-O-methyltransferase [Candidatus Thermoplasmatota archaeon]